MIRALPTSVRDSVRSGVVISSVAQCAEELILNALDAGAACVAVRVDLEIMKVQVVDNGSGLTYDDLQKVGDRYMTSKFSPGKSRDFHGYRGEALASIVDASNYVEILTRKDSTYRKRLGESSAVEVCETRRASVGTTVTVYGLFDRFPVRRKSVKVSHEKEKILSILKSFSLIYHTVTFSFRDDVTNTILYQSKRHASLANAFKSLYDNQINGDLYEVRVEKDDLVVHCHISQSSRVDKTFQFVFVNKRRVVNSEIHRTMNELLCKSAKFRKMNRDTAPGSRVLNACPVYIILVTVPSGNCDVVFDPMSTIVEFHDWVAVRSCLERAAARFLCVNAEDEQVASSPDSVHVPPQEIRLDELHDSLFSRPACRSAKNTNENHYLQNTDEITLLPQSTPVITKLPELLDSAVNEAYSGGNSENQYVSTDKSNEKSDGTFAETTDGKYAEKSDGKITEKSDGNSDPVQNCGDSIPASLLPCDLFPSLTSVPESVRKSQFVKSKRKKTLVNDGKENGSKAHSADGRKSHRVKLKRRSVDDRRKLGERDGATLPVNGSARKRRLTNEQIQEWINSTALHGNVNSTTLRGNVNSTTLRDNVNSTALCGNVNFTALHGDVNSTTLRGNVNSTTLHDNVNSTTLHGNVNSTTSHGDGRVAPEVRKNSGKYSKSGFKMSKDKKVLTTRENSMSESGIGKNSRKCTDSSGMKKMSTHCKNDLKKDKMISPVGSSKKRHSIRDKLSELHSKVKHIYEHSIQDACKTPRDQIVEVLSVRTPVPGRKTSYRRRFKRQKPVVVLPPTTDGLLNREDGNLDINQTSLNNTVLRKNSILISNEEKRFVPESNGKNAQDSRCPNFDPECQKNVFAKPSSGKLSRHPVNVSDSFCDGILRSPYFSDSEHSKPQKYARYKTIIAETPKYSFYSDRVPETPFLVPEMSTPDRRQDVLFTETSQIVAKSGSNNVDVNFKPCSLPTDDSFCVNFSSSESETVGFQPFNNVNFEICSNQALIDNEYVIRTGGLHSGEMVEQSLNQATQPFTLNERNNDISVWTPSVSEIVQVLQTSGNNPSIDTHAQTPHTFIGARISPNFASAQTPPIHINAKNSAMCTSPINLPTCTSTHSPPVYANCKSPNTKGTESIKINVSGSANTIESGKISGSETANNIDSGSIFGSEPANSIISGNTNGSEPANTLSIEFGKVNGSQPAVTTGSEPMNFGAQSTVLYGSARKRWLTRWTEDKKKADETVDESSAQKPLTSEMTSSEISSALEKDGRDHVMHSASSHHEPQISIPIGNESVQAQFSPETESLHRIYSSLQDVTIAGQKWLIVQDSFGRNVYIDPNTGNNQLIRPQSPVRGLLDSSNSNNAFSSNPVLYGTSTFQPRSKLERTLTLCDESELEKILASRQRSLEMDKNVKWRLVTQKGVEDIKQMFTTWANPLFERGKTILDIGLDSDIRHHSLPKTHTFVKSDFDDFHVMSQVDGKFIACLLNTVTNGQRRKLLVLIDQHAAHERVRLEMFQDNLRQDDDMIRSADIKPLNFNLSSEDLILLSSFKTKASKLGLEFRITDDYVEVTKVPYCFVYADRRVELDENKIGALIQELIQTCRNCRGALGRTPQVVEELLWSQACHGAVKFGDVLTKKECLDLVESLGKCRLPFQCAHGRPALVPLVEVTELKEKLPRFHYKPNLDKIRSVFQRESR